MYYDEKEQLSFAHTVSLVQGDPEGGGLDVSRIKRVGVCRGRKHPPDAFSPSGQSCGLGALSSRPPNIHDPLAPSQVNGTACAIPRMLIAILESNQLKVC